ncbi:MAG: hypothetical protein MUC28_00985 [Planctomycetes bacterium]|nr:hypothetical protein [Planctomycetota bacterium]
MPKPNNNLPPPLDGENTGQTPAPPAADKVKINVRASSVAEFTRRELPSRQEMEKFEAMIDDAAYASPGLDRREADAREEEIDESLNEIYQDDQGGMVDVKQLDIKKKHGLFFWLFVPLFAVASLAGAGYSAYHYFYLEPGSDATAVDFSIEGESEVVAGEEFFYTVHYRNDSNVAMRNARLSISYPDNFIFLDSTPETDGENTVWLIDSIPPKYSGQVKIKGIYIAPAASTGFIAAALEYMPVNFSSEFKKEASMNTTVRDIGIEINFDYIKSVLVGEDNEIKLKFRAKDKSFIGNFRLTLVPPENVELLTKKPAVKVENEAEYALVRPGVWEVPVVPAEERILPIYLKIKEKKTDRQDIPLVFEYAYNNEAATSTAWGRYYQFYAETISLEVMKSDLNLTMIINGSKEDQGVDFGDTLNYTIAYKNMGEAAMKDVIIMAVLESEFLDRATLDDPLKGKKKGNMISWTKEEIPELLEINQNEEGMIDFSVKVSALGVIDPRKTYAVKSYAQYSVGNKEDFSENLDNRSNTVINKINSNLELVEQVRYFSADNIPVGTGPHPPVVGGTTSYKTYWQLKNTLHELVELKVTAVLPDNVEWDGKNQASAGTINYDSLSRQVSWEIGRLPVTVTDAEAEFSLKITPVEADRNKIIVLLPGSKAQAIDSETKSALEVTTKAETTRLDDDDIAQGDGIVE